MTPITRSFALVIGVILLGILPGIAQAAIVVQGTRVVFPEKSHEVTVRINNTSAAPVLVQSWVDDGQATVSPEDLHVPFIVAPAVSRVDPSSAAVLRISAMQPQLPSDRESLFWLNVLETPSRSPGDETVLQFSFRTRIKLFYRPLSLHANAADPGERLTWKLIRKSGNKDPRYSVMEVTNPSPYYVSFGQVGVRVNSTSITAGTGIVEPFGKAMFTLSSPVPVSHPKAFVQYEVINDYGGRRRLEKPLFE